jgi:hypothetical protein
MKTFKNLGFLSGDEIRIGPSDEKVVFSFDGSGLKIASRVEERDVAVDRRNRNFVTICEKLLKNCLNDLKTDTQFLVILNMHVVFFDRLNLELTFCLFLTALKI